MPKYELGQVISEIKTINIVGSVALREAGLEIAQRMGISGFLMVFSRTGMEETSQAIGSSTPLDVEMVRAKIKTVLATCCSTSVQRVRMETHKLSRENFGEALGSLDDGGVAIFADKERTQFVGAMGFNGGTPEQDEAICRESIESIGLFTDVSPEIH